MPQHPSLAERKILERYPRAIVHMRRQLADRRFGLIFGAGLSVPYKIPNWNDLVGKIADDSRVQGRSILEKLGPRGSLPYTTEMLFEHYRLRRNGNAPRGTRNLGPHPYKIVSDWLDIVREHLYRKAPRNFAKTWRLHPYLETYLQIIRTSAMTVNYNFDDFLEQALHLTREKDHPSDDHANEKTPSLGYETVTNPWMQFRRKSAVIYHPNGVIPSRPMETPSDRFVFSEASYAKQMIGISSGDGAGMMTHLSKNTCLFIGLSLEDETLWNLLVQSARSNPGNYHYYISFVGKNGSPTDEQCRAITQTNFKVYNLQTLFLTESEIAALGKLLLMEDGDFEDIAKEAKARTSYRFYLTGPLGVGKSTAVNYFRNLVVYDEWVEPRIPVLAKKWNKLSSRQRKEADDWIAKQFMLKNDRLRHQSKCGVHLLDRGPLDPIAFTPKKDRPKKAQVLLNVICGDSRDVQVQAGKVILLTGDPQELGLRMILTKRAEYTADSLEQMEKDLKSAYGASQIAIIRTRGKSSVEVVKEIAAVVHMEPYIGGGLNLDKRLRDIARRKIRV